MKTIITLIILVFLFGCATCWKHPTKTDADFKIDEIMCSSYGAGQGNLIAPNYQTNYSYTYQSGYESQTLPTPIML